MRHQGGGRQPFFFAYVVAFNKWRWLRAVRVGVTPTFSLYVVPMLSSLINFCMSCRCSVHSSNTLCIVGSCCNVVSTASQTAAGNNNDHFCRNNQLLRLCKKNIASFVWGFRDRISGTKKSYRYKVCFEGSKHIAKFFLRCVFCILN